MFSTPEVVVEDELATAVGVSGDRGFKAVVVVISGQFRLPAARFHHGLVATARTQCSPPTLITSQMANSMMRSYGAFCIGHGFVFSNGYSSFPPWYIPFSLRIAKKKKKKETRR
ncbi:hypothetical protein HanXRQr2_Chr17g0798911 [Helianthus annuus]|uniref:Uncharacterized protein n=1 Tax=Helianthus annuus TaxID=4232 RepID=A0A9K3GTR2_HELAN|nr:hypothetical protein HanXRQr2_Chr17g0798911 [Helianthus annuus]KAJ0428885.1 hypothetical protein HanHA300_Chr17g0651071 [Helianthus annuus]